MFRKNVMKFMSMAMIIPFAFSTQALAVNAEQNNASGNVSVQNGNNQEENSKGNSKGNSNSNSNSNSNNQSNNGNNNSNNNQCHLVNQFQIKIQWFSFRESHCFFSSKT